MKFKGVELCCPHCRGDLEEIGDRSVELRCTACQRQYPVILGIPDLRIFPDPYIGFEDDRTKGRRVAERFDVLDFSGLVDFYYSITSVVPPKHAQQYKRGLMAGVARAEAALESWEQMTLANGQPVRGRSLLEIGCGTAPLLQAAASRFEQLIGVDIAFRWLVVGKKRLAEAGLDIPLICACAEALPFPNTVKFDRVVADSVLEHLRDQPQALAECYRVMQPGGRLFVSTPNRYCPGPDPHTGIWGGTLLPESWVAERVRRQGGIPPKRQLLSAGSLANLIRQAGFKPPQIRLPDVPDGQRRHFGPGIRLLIDLYHTAKRLPGSKQLLHIIGPLLQAVSAKPPAAAERRPVTLAETSPGQS